MKKLLLLLFLASGMLLVLGAKPAMTNVSVYGQALVQERCTQCHDLQRVHRRMGQDRAWWERTVDRMISKRSGLLNDEEREAVIDYLSNPQ